MADSDGPALKAGVFIVLMAVAGVALIAVVTGGLNPFAGGRTYAVTFAEGADLSGLAADAPVRVLGVPAGRVESVRVGGNDAGDAVEARVVIRVPDDVVLKRDAEVVAGSSLTGAVWLNVAALGSDAEADDTHPVNGSTSGIGSLVSRMEAMVPRAEAVLDRFGTAADGVKDALAEIDGAVGEVRAVVADVREPLRDTLDGTRALTASLRERLPGTLDRVDTLTGERLPGTLDRADGLADTLRTAAADARTAIGEARTALANVPPALSKIADAGGDTSEVVRRIGRMVDATRPRLLAAVDDAGSAAQELDGAVGELRAAPWRLLYKPKRRDEDRLALYAVAREYAQGARSLERAAEALAALDPAAADPADADALRSLVVAAYDRFAEVQGRLFTRLED